MKRRERALQDIQELILQTEQVSISLEEIGRWTKLDRKRVAGYCRLMIVFREGKVSPEPEKPRVLREALIEAANEKSGADPVFFHEEEEA